MNPFLHASIYRRSVEFGVIFFIFFSIRLVDVLPILEQEDEEEENVYTTPPSGELDGDSDGDSG